MNYIFTMSLSGSCMFLFVLLVKILLGERFSAKTYYFLGKAAVLYYLIPLPFLKVFYKKLFSVSVYHEPEPIYYMPEDMILFVSDTETALNATAKIQMAFAAIWICAVFLIGAFQINAYLKKKETAAALSLCRTLRAGEANDGGAFKRK